MQARPRCRWVAAGPHKASQRSARNTSGATSNTTTGTTPTRPGIQKTDIRDRMSACGGARGIRTPDLLIANETRYQLRHSPKDSNSLAPSQSAMQADHRRVRHDTEPTHATAPRARRPAARHQQLRGPLLGASRVQDGIQVQGDGLIGDNLGGGAGAHLSGLCDRARRNGSGDSRDAT